MKRRTQELIDGMRLRCRARLLALQYMLLKPRTLTESAAPWWEDDDGQA
jgi:hypothetical protein